MNNSAVDKQIPKFSFLAESLFFTIGGLLAYITYVVFFIMLLFASKSVTSFIVVLTLLLIVFFAIYRALFKVNIYEFEIEGRYLVKPRKKLLLKSIKLIEKKDLTFTGWAGDIYIIIIQEKNKKHRMTITCKPEEFESLVEYLSKKNPEIEYKV